jgi:hypothetical protein
VTHLVGILKVYADKGKGGISSYLCSFKDTLEELMHTQELRQILTHNCKGCCLLYFYTLGMMGVSHD